MPTCTILRYRESFRLSPVSVSPSKLHCTPLSCRHQIDAFTPAVGKTRVHAGFTTSSSRRKPEQWEVQRSRSACWQRLPSSRPRDLHKATAAPAIGRRIILSCAAVLASQHVALRHCYNSLTSALHMQVKSSSGGSKQQDGADWNKKQSASEWGEFLHIQGIRLGSYSLPLIGCANPKFCLHARTSFLMDGSCP